MPVAATASTDDVWSRRLGFWHLAEDHPDALAVAESPDGEFTYAALAALAHQTVHALRSWSVPEGATVAVLAPNGILSIQMTLACQQAGWCLLLVNGYLTATEVVGILEHSGASVLVLHQHHRDILNGKAGERIQQLCDVMGTGDVPGAAPLDTLVAEQPASAPDRRTTGNMMVYSSGTTGAPKGILRPLRGRDPDAALNAMAVFGRAFDFRPFDGPHLVSTAMYHGGSHSYYMGALNVGHALVIMARFDAEGALELIDRHQVRTAYMVATQFYRMLHLPEETRGKYNVSSLHSVVHSAAPCPQAVKRAMFEWWGPVIWETYGGMEGAATIAKPHRWLEKPGTVGRAVRGVTLAIFDDDGNRLGPNETGHIYFKTESGFSYHQDEELTAEAHRGDMFTIGDVGYLDEDGYLFIQDRAKDMIISGGVNIYPAEVEAVLLQHDAVSDAAVIGIPDEDWGEAVLAIVELREGHEPSEVLEQELLGHCRGHLGAYKRPRRVEFRSGLPRTDAGKLYKRVIRDEYWADAGRRV